MSAPVDVAAIRAEFANEAARAAVPLLVNALERERKIAAAWRALAIAVAEHASFTPEQIRAIESDPGDYPWAADLMAARGALRALGIDPEAP